MTMMCCVVQDVTGAIHRGLQNDMSDYRLASAKEVFLDPDWDATMFELETPNGVALIHGRHIVSVSFVRV